MSTEENRNLGHRWAELWNADRSLDVIDEIVDESFVSHGAPPGLPPGREGVHIWASIFRKAFPDLRSTAEDVIVEGDKVVERFSASGTFNGEFMGIPPTGKSYSISGIDIHRLSGGKMAEHWHVVDLFGQMQQLGLIPQPAGAGA